VFDYGSKGEGWEMWLFTSWGEGGERFISVKCPSMAFGMYYEYEPLLGQKTVKAGKFYRF
jgi:hypothetical protein